MRDFTRHVPEREGEITAGDHCMHGQSMVTVYIIITEPTMVGWVAPRMPRRPRVAASYQVVHTWSVLSGPYTSSWIRADAPGDRDYLECNRQPTVVIGPMCIDGCI